MKQLLEEEERLFWGRWGYVHPMLMRSREPQLRELGVRGLRIRGMRLALSALQSQLDGAAATSAANRPANEAADSAAD
jgi:hypothetical protein